MVVSGSWLLKAVRCLATSKFTTSRTKIHFDFFTFASVSTDLLVGGLTKKAVENRRPHKVGGVLRKAGFLCIQVAGNHYYIPSAFGGINGTLHVELIRHKF